MSSTPDRPEVTATATITDQSLGEISPYIFGGMIEHFGRTVYPGIWDVAHDVPRPDVKAAMTAMGVRAIRYPGGCFSDAYHWRDGVGPKAERPVTESFWSTIATRLPGFGAGSRFGDTPEQINALVGPPEPNLLGTDEFLQYCLDLDAEPFLVVNIGTGTVEEAADWVRYCNVDRTSPRTVQWWSLGNETWGSHEFGHRPPAEYGRVVVEFATAMRAVDPDIKISVAGMPISLAGETLGSEDGSDFLAYDAQEWNRELLRVCAEHIDLLSVHWYFPGMIGRALATPDDIRQLSTAPQLLETVLRDTAAFVDEVTGGSRRIDLSFDEWNRMVQFDDHLETNHPLADTAFFAGCFNALLANADRVPMAIMSHLVNCLAPIQTDDHRFFTTVAYLVAQLYERFARGTAVRVEVETPRMTVPAFVDLGEGNWAGPLLKQDRTASVVTAVATRSTDGTNVFIVNADPETDHHVELHGLAGEAVRTRWIDGPDLWAQNSFEHPDTLRLAEETVPVSGGTAVVRVPRAGVVLVEHL
jgi:alpha-L-arabinofuranosidase